MIQNQRGRALVRYAWQDISILLKGVWSTGLVSPPLSQNIWEVSKKEVGEGSATHCRPRDYIPPPGLKRALSGYKGRILLAYLL